MSFSVIDGRPVGTQITDKGVIHYTCNAPSDEILEENKIQKVGDKFGVEPKEVLVIPEGLFKKTGVQADTITAENLLSRLGRR